MTQVDFPSNGSTAPGYLSTPTSGSGIPVVVLQEYWGLEDHIRDVCDRLSAEGFVALAPDLYRGETTTQPDEAEQKMMAMSMDQAERDMRGAVDYLAQHEATQGRGVGSVGFCLGGGLSVWAASANLGVGGERQSQSGGSRLLLLHHAPRQARLLQDRGPRPGPLRYRRRLRLSGRRQVAGTGDERRRGRRPLRVL